MRPSRRAPKAADMARLANTLVAAGDPPPVYAALERLCGETIGHRLFTIMRFDPDRAEVERVHSSLPTVYPVGGRKRKKDTAWSNHVLGAMKVFRATEPAGIRAAFDDYETILGLGLGSVLNIPVVSGGRCVGTMNLLHETGWYRPQDEATGLRLGAFLIPALLTGRSI